MIRVVSNQDTGYQGSWDEFVKWISPQKELQFDVETNVTSFECTRQLKTLQFGDIQDTVQYVLEYALLTPEQLQVIKGILESWEIVKYIHNASFEYVTMCFHGIEVHNVFCTLVAEQVIMGGAPMKDLKLTDLTQKYLGFRMDKTLQTSFGDGILNKEKVEYAADDVKPLYKIAEYQKGIIAEHKLENVIWLEMRSLLAFSECTFHGVGLDLKKWQENITLAEPVVKASKDTLDNWIRQDSRLLAKAIELNYYKTEDQVNFNLNSPAQKLKLLQWVFPEIQGSSATIIKAFVRDNNSTLSVEEIYMLLSLVDKNYEPFSNYLVSTYRERLIEEDFLFPEGTIEINWNSPAQVLLLAKAVEPKLKDLSEESLADTTHELFDLLSDYKDSLKLVSSYGQAFIDKHVQLDGKVRTHYNQVVSTGRSSSAKPNMQNIPAKEAPYEVIKTWLKDNPGKTANDFNYRYRNSFIYDEGWDFVDSDFTGQELALIAHASQDDVWRVAIEKGEDLHSITASMVFGKKWEAATEDTCVFKKTRQKCGCKGHKTLRTAIKTINFG